MEITCPSDAALIELVEGSLDPAAAAAVEEHIDRCATCRRVVAELGRSLAAAPTPWTARSTAPPPRTPPAALGRGAVVSRYLLLDKIGAGGMGVVFAAYDPELDRKVALKVLRPDLGRAHEQVRSRFLREARAMALLSHPNVITVHDVGSVGDDPFVAMELVTGGTLSSRLPRLPRGRRRVAEILDLFARAGAGLAAAHAAGLVHRDFKPDNVLIGDDGRVRVTDFGLVRRLDVEPGADGSAPEPPAPGALPAAADGVATTLTGARLGTPAYMAPEQHQGGRVDARSDQFAFCVALYEALHGERPFAGVTVAELGAATAAGRIREPPPGAEVPAWIRPILRRGLSARPEDRFPSMTALLAALRSHAGAPARRGPRIAAALLGVLLVAGILTFRRPAPAAPAPCRDAAAGLAPVWNDARRERVTAAFAATGKPFAADGARAVLRGLDTYAASWTAARTEACEATRVRGEQSDAMLDLRAACLDRRARSLETLVALLEQAGPDLVTRGVDAVRALPELDRCAPSALATPVARPTSPGSEARLADVEAHLAEADALLAAGKYQETETAATAVVAEARAAGYAPLLADALGTLADAQDRNEHDAAVEASLYECLWAAEAGHADRQAAWAWANLVYTVGYKEHRVDETARLVRHAEAALARIGGDSLIEIRLLHARGTAAVAAGQLDLAVSQFEAAVALAGRVGPDDENLAVPLNALAATEIERGELTLALALQRRALGITERAYGPEHPDVAMALDWLAHGHWALGQYDEALAESRRALAIRAAALAADNPWIAFSHGNLAVILNSAGRPDEALAEAELSIAEGAAALGPDEPRMGILRAERARALLLLGRVREATAEARASLRLCVDETGPHDSEAWICREVMGTALRAGGDLAGAHAQYRALADEARAERGPDHPHVALGLTGMGICETAAGRLGPAVANLERALAIREAREGDPADRARTELALAEALWRTGDARPRALTLARRARDAYVAMGQATLADLAAAEAWIASHRAPPR